MLFINFNSSKIYKDGKLQMPNLKAQRKINRITLLIKLIPALASLFFVFPNFMHWLLFFISKATIIICILGFGFATIAFFFLSVFVSKLKQNTKGALDIAHQPFLISMVLGALTYGLWTFYSFDWYMLKLGQFLFIYFLMGLFTFPASLINKMVNIKDIKEEDSTEENTPKITIDITEESQLE